MRGARVRRVAGAEVEAADGAVSGLARAYGAAGELAPADGAVSELARVDDAACEPAAADGAVGELAVADDGSGEPEADEASGGWRWLTGRAAGWWFLLAVVVAVLVANAALAGWSSDSGPREVGAPGPESLQARSVAQREFGLLSGGGWAAAWELWSASARSVLSQSEFVRLNTACRPALGVPYVIDAATGDGTTVQVAWHQGALSGSASVIYEGGAWRFVPDAATLADYRLGVDQLVGRRKAAGQCH